MNYISKLAHVLFPTVEGVVGKIRYDTVNPFLVHVYVRTEKDVKDVLLSAKQYDEGEIQPGKQFSGRNLVLPRIMDSDRIKYSDLI